MLRGGILTGVSIGLGKAAFSNDIKDVFVIHGLGSCIGLALYDKRSRCGGLCHIVLPVSENPDPEEPARFANTAVPWAINKLLELGANRMNLVAKIVGGASLFGSSSPLLNIGERNIEAVSAALDIHRIPLAAQEVGGDKGRTMALYIADGRVEVRSATASVYVI